MQCGPIARNIVRGFPKTSVSIPPVALPDWGPGLERSTMRFRNAFPIVMTAVATSLAGCAAPEAPVVDVAGNCATVYGGEVCTWARMQGDRVVSVGATIPIASVENAPAELHHMAWPPEMAAEIPLPDAVAASTGLRHLTVYWEAMGHPPGPYLTPHFDFHFYTIPSAERMAIDCVDVSKPAKISDGYSLPDITLPPDMAKAIGVSDLPGLCVPQMGMHSLLTSEMESATPFRGTMVIGYIKGKPIFVEPMISKAMLMEKASFDLVVPTVPGLTPAAPRTFRAEYDAQGSAYRFTFSGFGASN